MKKIAINIIVCFLLIIPFDFCLEFIDWFRNEILNISIEELKEYNKHGINLVSPFHYTLKHISFEEYYKNESKNYSDDRRITRSSNHNKGAIIIFGDSFAYGAWLDDNETLNYQLSKLTGRTVYNRIIVRIKSLCFFLFFFISHNGRNHAFSNSGFFLFRLFFFSGRGGRTAK